MKSSHWGTLFFLLGMLWLIWIFVAGLPLDRMSRTCQPVHWSGRLVTSLTSLAAPSYARSVDNWFENQFLNCRYVIWQQFYEDEYRAEQARSVAAEHRKAKP